jgi:Protein of unknown function (DUF1698)
LPENPGPDGDLRDLLARIRALDPWFHDIDLGPELKTKLGPCADEPLDHPRPTWELLKPHLPQDLSGQSVLDVGCNAGFYSFETKRLGAIRVLGIDAQRREIAQACLAALLHGVGFEGVTHVALSEERSLFVCTRKGDASRDAQIGSYRARFSARETAVSIAASDELALTIRVWNVGTATWEASVGREEERGAVLLGVHLLDAAENVLEWDFKRYRGSLS